MNKKCTKLSSKKCTIVLDSYICRPFRPQAKGSVEALARAVERLRVYNHEFYDSVDLIHIVNDLCEEMNSEVSQATNEIPNLRWEMNEKEHLHKLKKDLLKPYFEDFITRKVTNEAMVNFRQSKYSVDPRYIGKEIEVELSESTCTSIITESGFVRTR